MFPRLAATDLAAALADTPAVLLVGPRQSGKTTLVRAADRAGRRYLTFDDAAPLWAAEADPDGFVAGLDGPVTLDEIQKAPALLPAIKAAIDRDRRPGRFLLTGSANVLLLPRVSESLAGRVEVLTLLPLAQAEIEARSRPRGVPSAAVVDRLFGAAALPARFAGKSDWLPRAIAGGFPEVVLRPEGRRRVWFASYLTTLLSRDARDIADIASVASLSRVLSLLATRAAGLLNVSDIARSVDVPQTTLVRYLALLERLYLITRLAPWSANLGKRIVKAPKLFLVDTGLLAHLLGASALGAVGDSTRGALLENLVATELAKLIPWSETRPAMFHFRTHEGHEIDFLLEDARGRLVGIEVKATRSPTSHDFRGLRMLRDAVGARFHRGVVLYDGEDTVPFDAELFALPVSTLWRSPELRTARRRRPT